MVGVDDTNGRLVATGMIFFERRFSGKGVVEVGHVEDIVVSADYGKQGLGNFLMEELMKIAKGRGTQKVILNCAEHLVKFYGKSGFKTTGR